MFRAGPHSSFEHQCKTARKKILKFSLLLLYLAFPVFLHRARFGRKGVLLKLLCILCVILLPREMPLPCHSNSNSIIFHWKLYSSLYSDESQVENTIVLIVLPCSIQPSPVGEKLSVDWHVCLFRSTSQTLIHPMHKELRVPLHSSWWQYSGERHRLEADDNSTTWAMEGGEHPGGAS